MLKCQWQRAHGIAAYPGTVVMISYPAMPLYQGQPPFIYHKFVHRVHEKEKRK